MKTIICLLNLQLFIVLVTNAQNVGIGTLTPQAPLTVAPNKTVLFGGDTLNAGTKMMWLPAKAAFRAGAVDGVNWNPDSIGNWSFASGYNTRAIGSYSFAIGSNSTASGNFSIAMGSNTEAFGDWSTAIGSSAKASKNFATAMGLGTKASGEVSTSMGFGSIASGNVSTAMGLSNSRAYGSLAIGRSNDTIVGSSTVSWIDTDPLFYIGNGSGVGLTPLHNAMVVYKNGNMILKNPTIVNTNPASFTVPISGAGTRMMWLPEKSAFRVGTVGTTIGSGVNWNADSIGLWSFASGRDTKAKGDGSTAIGNRTHATGLFSTAMGFGTIASGGNSTAIGNSTIASGGNSTAMGDASTASGNSSTAMGLVTNAKSFVSTAIGQYNDTIAGSNQNLFIASDPLFYIGNGSGFGLTPLHNALVVYKNGTLQLQNQTSTPDNISDKFYVLNNIPYYGANKLEPSQLEKITEGGNTGWRLLGRNPANYGNIGLDAVDLSINIDASSTRGATGIFSTTMGRNTTASSTASTAMGNRTNASGSGSTAMGILTTASGFASIAMGDNTFASGDISTAIGLETVSKAFASLSIGRFNDSINSSNKTNWISTDPLLILGNGSSNAARSNALVVYKNGNTDINGFTRLGEVAEAAPKIKMKELTLTSAVTANGQSAINHGLSSSKIISVTTLMEWTTGFFAPVEYSPDPLLRYNYFVSPTQIIIQNNAANCTYICTKPVKILITYKE